MGNISRNAVRGSKHAEATDGRGRSGRFARGLRRGAGPLLVMTVFVGFLGCTDRLPRQSRPAASPDSSGLYAIELSVARHVGQAFGADRVDEALETLSELLQSADSFCPDVACPVVFRRRGEVGSFNSGAAIVTTESELDEIFDEPEDMKVVSLMVGVCGPTSVGDMSVVLGCAYRGGSAVVTEFATPDVWGHEWGHVQGLSHRDDCWANVMHSVAPATDAITQSECNAYLAATPDSGFLFFRPVAAISHSHGGRDPLATLAQAPGETRAEWLLRLVDGVYHAGLPTAAIAEKLEEADAPLLLSVVFSDAGVLERQNACRMLGFTGSGVAAAVLGDLASESMAGLDAEELAVRAEAFLAVARLDGADGGAEDDGSSVDGAARVGGVTFLAAEAEEALAVVQAPGPLDLRASEDASLRYRLAVMALGAVDSGTAAREESRAALAALRSRLAFGGVWDRAAAGAIDAAEVSQRRSTVGAGWEWSP